MLLFGYGAHRAPLQCCSLATALTERRYNAAAASGRVSKILIRCGLCLGAGQIFPKLEIFLHLRFFLLLGYM